MRFRLKCASKYEEKFFILTKNPEIKNEYRKIVTHGIKITGKENPEDILNALLSEEKKINVAINENIGDLIDRNKEIVIFAQSQGELIIALNAANKILDYFPQDNFAFRERGCVNHRLGRIEDAEQDILKSIELSMTDIERASSLISAGVFCSRIGRLEKAAEYCEAAYNIGELIDNSAIKASSDLNLSNIYDKLGKTQEAEILINRAIIECEKIGDKKILAAAKINQATYYLQHAKIYEAKQRLEDVKKIAEDSNDDLLKSTIYTNLGNLYSTLSDYYLAKEYLLNAIEIDKKLKMEGSLATNYGSLGIIYKNQGKLLEAEEEQQKSMILFKKLKDKEGVSRSLINIGNIKLQQKDYEKAKQYYDEGLIIAERTGNRQIIADGKGSLSILYMEQGIFKEAEKYIKEALSIYNDTDDDYGKAKILFLWGYIHKETGNKESAFEKWNESKKLFAKIGLPHMVENVNTELNKLKIKNTIINDPDGIKKPYEYLIQTYKCKIPDGLTFSFEKIHKDEDMTIAVNEETSFLCFENNISITINDFIERIRLYYEKSTLGRDENVKRDKVELNTVDISRYKINIKFPPKTYFKPTKGCQLIVKSAQGIIEIQTEFSRFSNFEMFSIDRNTIGQRGWASAMGMDIGMVLQKNDTEDGKYRIDFQAKDGSMKINKEGEIFKDSILEKVEIELEKIE